MGASSGLNDSSTVELTGKLMVAAVIVLFLMVIFVLFLHLYVKWFWWRTEEPPNTSNSHRGSSRFVFNPEQEDPTRATVSRGLDRSVLMSLPVFVFGAHDEVKEGFECAVCLCELVDGEKVRILPTCKHGFHVDCIDMWFQSHSTCPLCRNSVSTCTSNIDSSVLSIELGDDSSVLPVPNRLNVNGYTSEVRDFPTNVLFWGNQTQVSSVDSLQVPCSSSSSSSSSTSRLEGRLVIDIPTEALGEIFSPCSHTSAEEMKSPMPTRLRSLKRLLSREQRVVVACSHSSIDV